MIWLNNIKFSGTHSAEKKALVALSFDDGPSRESSLEVLKILDTFQSQATFFWIVENVIKLKKTRPDVFDQIIFSIKNGGHEIGLHAPYDYKPTFVSRFRGKFTKQEIKVAKEKLIELTGLSIKFYRPHYLQFTPATIFAKELELATVFGDIIHYEEPDALKNLQIKKFSRVKPGNILMFHDGVTLLRKTTYITEILPTVLKNLKEKGIHGTTVSEVFI